jgi:hypothetical protein
MNSTWRFFFSQQDGTVLGAEYLPPTKFREARAEGIRYRILTRQNVDGLSFPKQVLLEGVDINGVENGHVRITKMDFRTEGPFDLGLFLHPDKARDLDTGNTP